MAIDLRNLRHFVATAENGSFRRAANVLHMQQSSVSRAVRQLEDALGVSLFERRVSGAQLTDAGHRLLRDVRPALEQLELARKASGEHEEAAAEERMQEAVVATDRSRQGAACKSLRKQRGAGASTVEGK